MTVWAVQTDWSLGESEHSSDIYLYKTKELALKSFAELVAQDKNENYCNVYHGVSGSSGYLWEEDDGYWCIWEDGMYTANHSEIRVAEHMVVDENEYERLRSR